MDTIPSVKSRHIRATAGVASDATPRAKGADKSTARTTCGAGAPVEFGETGPERLAPQAIYPHNWRHRYLNDATTRAAQAPRVPPMSEFRPWFVR